MKETDLGLWNSPISSDLITSKTLRLSAPRLEADGSLYWLEGRPSEGGRQVLVRRDGAGAIHDVSPDAASAVSVRTRVHEYGGGEYTIVGDLVVFVNFADQRLYTQRLSGSSPPSPPVALTAADSGLRFADFEHDAVHQRLVCVCERHGGPEVVNSIVGVDLSSGVVTTLATGHDFYSAPRLSHPDSGLVAPKLAWLQWDFPAMPWDCTELCVADVASDGSLHQLTRVAGGAEEAVQQPVWDSRGHRLYFISDTTGWANLYFWDTHHQKVNYLCRMDAEFSVPMWVFGISTYQVLESGHVLATYRDPQEAGICLGLIRPSSKPGNQDKIVRLDCGFGALDRLSVQEVALGSGNTRISVAALAASPTMASKVVELVVGSVDELYKSTPADWHDVKLSSDIEVDPGFLSAPRTIEFPSTGGVTAFMNYYAPHNKDHCLPAGQLPPLLVKSHGGPTSAARSELNLGIQYWTSQGFAVADVNYGGSTGYGRAYRNRLRGSWGVVDVDDCANAATYLADQGLVDGKRLCIDGVSAGGYTTLACLAFRDVFSAGASLYGIADMETLAKDTHKFESRYMDGLVGPYPAAKEIYEARSPINHVDGFKAPVVFFQGEEDQVVPPNQAIAMHAALKGRGIATSLVLFPGEQHGFRGAAAIRASLDGELYFYGRVLGFAATMPEGVPTPLIDNLDAPAEAGVAKVAVTV